MIKLPFLQNVSIDFFPTVKLVTKLKRFELYMQARLSLFLIIKVIEQKNLACRVHKTLEMKQLLYIIPKFQHKFQHLFYVFLPKAHTTNLFIDLELNGFLQS